MIERCDNDLSKHIWYTFLSKKVNNNYVNDKQEYRKMVDRVPVPVIAIQGRTEHWCKNVGYILKFEVPNL